MIMCKCAVYREPQAGVWDGVWDGGWFQQAREGKATSWGSWDCGRIVEYYSRFRVRDGSRSQARPMMSGGTIVCRSDFWGVESRGKEEVVAWLLLWAAEGGGDCMNSSSGHKPNDLCKEPCETKSVRPRGEDLKSEEGSGTYCIGS